MVLAVLVATPMQLAALVETQRHWWFWWQLNATGGNSMLLVAMQMPMVAIHIPGFIVECWCQHQRDNTLHQRL